MRAHIYTRAPFNPLLTTTIHPSIHPFVRSFIRSSAPADAVKRRPLHLIGFSPPADIMDLLIPILISSTPFRKKEKKKVRKKIKSSSSSHRVELSQTSSRCDDGLFLPSSNTHTHEWSDAGCVYRNKKKERTEFTLKEEWRNEMR